MATMSVLGFSSPSFSFGMDIMLPVGINQQLRDLLLSDPDAAAGVKGRASVKDRDVLAVKALQKFKGVFVPEVRLASTRRQTVRRMRSWLLMEGSGRRCKEMEGDERRWKEMEGRSRPGRLS